MFRGCESNVTGNDASPSFFLEWCFVECVQHTFLLWLPCLTFWSFIPYALAGLRQLNSQLFQWTILIKCRLVVFLSIIACLLILLILVTVRFKGTMYWRWTIAFSFGGLLVTYITCTYLVAAQQKKMISGNQAAWLFIITAIVAGVFEFSTSCDKLRKKATGLDATIAVFFMVYYVLCLAELILLSFSTVHPPFKEEEGTDQRPWPEGFCSYSSRLFYSWFSGLLCTGYRRALRIRDVWYVSHDELTRTVFARFGPFWRDEFGPVVYSKRFGMFAKPKDDKEVHQIVKEPSLLRVIFKTFRRGVFEAAFYKLINDCLLFVEPFIVKLMILFYSDTTIPKWHGFVYVVLIGVAMIIKATALQQHFFIMTRLGVQIRTALISAVYRKSLLLTWESRSAWTTGEIVNLMSVDASRFSESATYAQMLWSAPLQIVVGVFFLYIAVGHAVWAGVGFMVFVMLANCVACRFYEQLTEKQMAEKDKRMKIIAELLNGIKVIKLYAWEPAFQRNIHDIRQNELKYIRISSYIGGVMEFAWNCTTIFSCLIIFSVYLHMSPTKHLSAETVFFVISVFHIIEFPMAIIPMILGDLMMLLVSIKRLSNYFSAQEVTEGQIMRTKTGAELAIKVSHANFTWISKTDQEPLLRDIDLEVNRGRLVAVVGQVGSGKSSLLASLCGEMHKISGLVQIDGALAYSAQQPWILNASFRDNILFGKKFDKAVYDEIVKACALEPDIASIVGGDLAEIGERGVNLSGGQKQRLSLARAVYQDEDVYLLDDPLSAVDVTVGKNLFDNVIGRDGLLCDKTRILVTHDLTYLEHCDLIIVMENGRISEIGQYKQLKKRRGALFHLMQEFRANERATLDRKKEMSAEHMLDVVVSRESLSDDSEKRSSSNIRAPSRSKNTKQPSKKATVAPKTSKTVSNSAQRGESDRVKSPQSDSNANGTPTAATTTTTAGRETLVTEETVESGDVSWRMYWTYAWASGIGLPLYLIFLTFSVICNMLSVIWLQEWTDRMDDDGHHRDNRSYTGHSNHTEWKFGLMYYGFCAAGQVFFTAIFVVCYACFQVRAAKRIHSKLLYGIIRAPLAFFHSTPAGRIVNRFGKDINTVDNEVPGVLDQVAHTFILIVAAVGCVIYATPIFTIAVIPLVMMYYICQRFYVKTARQLRRLEAVTRSPVYSLFQETLHGSTTIRAYTAQERFIGQCSRLVDANSSVQMSLVASNRWIGIRLDAVGSLLVCAAAFVIVLMRPGISYGAVGLSLSFALSVRAREFRRKSNAWEVSTECFLEMTGLFSWGVQQTSILETEVVAVERISEYMHIKPEAEWNSRKALAKWPIVGGVQFKNYSVRYRPDLEPALKEVNLTIQAGHKIGVIGRTGAGKTSLTLGLFRLVEPASGQIFIDEIDIGSIGLHDLRRKMTVIPQELVLFTGTVRFNVDPFGEYSDDAVWGALELSQLKEFVAALPEGLKHEITEGGANMSVGQRQLICLARAVLRKSKVIVLDEATAAVDSETDALVQNTVRTYFRDSTVIVIAHRLNSVQGCDMILVLDNGQVVEYDKPDVLLKRRDSYYRLVSDVHAEQFSRSGSM